MLDTTFPWLAGLFAAGVLSGVAGGLLGIGAGSLMVPVLVVYFGSLGLGKATVGVLSVATSLAAIVLLSTRAFVSHRRHGAGSWRAIAAAGPTGIMGTLVGSDLALRAGGHTVIVAFAALEVVLGSRYLWGAPQDRRPSSSRNAGWLGWAVVGLASGLLSSFFGVGGGVVAVPLQVSLLAIPIHEAIANSSGLIVINALIGTARYALAETPAPIGSTAIGWVDVAAAGMLGGGGVLGAPLGVRFAHATEPHTLRRVFGAFLIAVGFALAVQSLR